MGRVKENYFNASNKPMQNQRATDVTSPQLVLNILRSRNQQNQPDLDNTWEPSQTDKSSTNYQQPPSKKLGESSLYNQFSAPKEENSIQVRSFI